MVPAGSARHRRSSSQATIWRRWAVVNCRGSKLWAIPTADTARPARPASKATLATTPRPRRDGRLATWPMPSGEPEPESLAGPSGQFCADSGCHVTRGFYGLLAIVRFSVSASEPSSVRRQARVDLVDPGHDAATDMDCIGESCVFHDGQRFGAADTRL